MAALWESLDPPRQVAINQASWDRRAMVLRMRDAGMTIKEIAVRLGGISYVRAWQIVTGARRKNSNILSPIERWLTGDDAIRKLAMKSIPEWRQHQRQLREVRRREREEQQVEAQIKWEQERAAVEVADQIQREKTALENFEITKWRLTPFDPNSNTRYIEEAV